MLCSIIPYSRSFDDTLLTYSLPDEFQPFVKVGSSVHVPWGKETIIGIVGNFGTDTPLIFSGKGEGEIKPITGPHCTTPWLSASEISLLIHLARHLFVRIHTVAQLFLPLGVFGLFEKENFLNLVPPVNPEASPTTLSNRVSPKASAVAQGEGTGNQGTGNQSPPLGDLGGLGEKGESEYIIAPDEAGIKSYLESNLPKKPGAVILPEGISVKSWSSIHPTAVIDHHPKSISTQKKIYLDILTGVHPTLFGTRRTLTKRIGYYPDIYIVYDNITSDIVFGQHRIPLWMMCEMLETHGHTIHYLTTTPSVRILCDFLHSKKSIKYL